MNFAYNSRSRQMKYKYEIIRSARKSVSINISSENKITVHCPWTMHITVVEKYLSEKMGWIDKVVKRNAERLADNDDVIEYRAVYLNGEKFPLVFCDENRVGSDAVYVKSVDDISELYKACFSESFIENVYRNAELMAMKPSSVKIKNYKGRWGCCDAANNLIFNYILFMLPPELQKYVIVHEICHTICHNHSAAFWALVAQYEPRYKALKKALAGYNFLISLY